MNSRENALIIIRADTSENKKREIQLNDNGNDKSYDVFYKFVLMGNLGAGKSSLVSRYTEDKFKTDYKKTIGVEFGKKVNENAKGKVTLQIWDTDGDIDDCKSFFPTYLNQANALILVFALNNEKALYEIEEFIANKEIKEKLATEPVIILVGTKFDLVDSRFFTTERINEFLNNHPNIQAYIETSAKNKINVSEVFEVATQFVLERDNAKSAMKSNNKDLWRNNNKYLKETKQLEKIWSNVKYKTNEQKIIALLKDYTKNNNAFLRFFAGYWKRHHIKEIYNICTNENNRDVFNLLADIKKFTLKN